MPSKKSKKKERRLDPRGYATASTPRSSHKEDCDDGTHVSVGARLAVRPGGSVRLGLRVRAPPALGLEDAASPPTLRPEESPTAPVQTLLSLPKTEDSSPVLEGMARPPHRWRGGPRVLGRLGRRNGWRVRV